MIIPVILYRIDRFWERTHLKSYTLAVFAWNKKPWYAVFRIITFFFLFVGYLLLAAEVYGKRAAKAIYIQSEVQISYSDGEHIKGRMIGKTSDVLFLLRADEVRIIPLNGMVKAIELDLRVLNVNVPGIEAV